MMNRIYCLLSFLLIGSLLGSLQAQEAPQTAVCVWDAVGLRAAPSQVKGANYLVSIRFGEEVTLLGENETVFEDGHNRRYMKVQLLDGKQGWVNEYLFEVGGKAAVLKKGAAIYSSPGSGTISMDVFLPGELAVLSAEAGEWKSLTSPSRKKVGWVKGEDIISTDLEDVALGGLLLNAMSRSNASDRKSTLASIKKTPQYKMSKMQEVVDTYEKYAANPTQMEEDIFAQVAANTEVADTRSLDDLGVTRGDDDLTEEGNTGICLWDYVPLFKTAGRSSDRTGKVIHRWEIVQMLGEEKSVIDDDQQKRVYTKIQVADGTQGWAHKYLFEEEGEVAVILKDLSVYKRPGAPATLTLKTVQTGDLLVKGSSAGGWVEVTSAKRAVQGWVKGGEYVSSYQEDVEVASLLQYAQKAKTVEEKKRRLSKIQKYPAYEKSALKGLVDQLASAPDMTIEETGFSSVSYRGEAKPENKPSTKPQTEENSLSQLKPTAERSLDALNPKSHSQDKPKQASEWKETQDAGLQALNSNKPGVSEPYTLPENRDLQPKSFPLANDVTKRLKPNSKAVTPNYEKPKQQAEEKIERSLNENINARVEKTQNRVKEETPEKISLERALQSIPSAEPPQAKERAMEMAKAQKNTEPKGSVERVFDQETGRAYWKITEEGSILPVAGPKNTTSPFVAYHKKLPKGTKMLVGIPDNPGVLEVEVVGKLKESRPQVVGLTGDCMKLLFGDKDAKDVKLIYYVEIQQP